MSYLLLYAWMLSASEPRIEVVAIFAEMKACRTMAYEMSKSKTGGAFSCVVAR